MGLPEADRHAVLALQQLEDEACPCGCGQPMEESCSESGPEYRVERVTCRARAVLDQAREDDRDEPGLMHYVVPDVATPDELNQEREAEAQALAALRARIDPEEA